MTYFEGFIAAVPTANRDAYHQHAAQSEPLFKEAGATRMVETWADDVPHGGTTDFYRAVEAKDDESIVFSWIEFPDKTTRDTGMARLMEDPRMEAIGASMPFDGKRMIYGGFAPLIDDRTSGTAGYVDGYVLPVPDGNKERYRAIAESFSKKATALGALRVVEAWGDDLPDGKVTDYRRAAKAKDGENVMFSWIEWPDKATRDKGWAAIMADPDMDDHDKDVFDGKRMFWGGFQPIFDT